MKTLREKLIEILPQKSDQTFSDGALKLQIDSQPIRRAAEAFAAAIDFQLPADRDELIMVLWAFCELMQGEMEKREIAQQKLIHDVLGIDPVFFFVTDKAKNNG